MLTVQNSAALCKSACCQSHRSAHWIGAERGYDLSEHQASICTHFEGADSSLQRVELIEVNAVPAQCEVRRSVRDIGVRGGAVQEGEGPVRGNVVARNAAATETGGLQPEAWIRGAMAGCHATIRLSSAPATACTNAGGTGHIFGGRVRRARNAGAPRCRSLQLCGVYPRARRNCLMKCPGSS